MQLAFFLLPKSESLYLTEHQTFRQAMEKMQHHGLGAIPILNDAGQYVGVITTSDLLWHLKDKYALDIISAEKILIKDVPRRHDNEPVTITTDVRILFRLAMVENFIPVIDDLGVFIGIVRRREIMEYYRQQRQASLDKRMPGSGELFNEAAELLDEAGKS